MYPNTTEARCNHRRAGGWAAVLVGLAALVLAACSGDGGGGSPTSPTSSPASTAGSSQSTDSKPGGGAEFCVTLKDLATATDALPAPGTADEAGPLRAYGALLDESAAKLQATAPTELQSAMEIFVQNSRQNAASFKAGARPPAKTQSAEERTASQKIGKYAADNCRG